MPRAAGIACPSPATAEIADLFVYGTLASPVTPRRVLGRTRPAISAVRIAFNPSFARGWHISGVLKLWAGQPDLAIEHLETALRLSPRASVGSSLLNIASAYYFLGRFDEALPRLLLAIQEDPKRTQAYRFLAACYAHLGRLDDAREALARLRAILSRYFLDPFESPELSSSACPGSG